MIGGDGKKGEFTMQNKQTEYSASELIGILKATSIVAKDLAKRLIRIEEAVKKQEEKLRSERG